MKIAITSRGKDIDSEVDQRFGRCMYFIIVDPETLDFKVIENTGKGGGGGVGIASAQKIVNEGVEAVLTGNCGPNAFQVLSEAGIKVVTGVSGTVRDAVEMYKSKQFKESDGPSVDSHFGIG